MIQLRLLLLLFFFSSYNLQSISNRQILDNVFAAIDNIETLRFKLKKTERIEGVLKYGEQDVKFNRKPMKVYTYVVAPHKGVEVLYIDGKNNDDAYINPNAFPYMNLNFDPYGSVMRKGNHHTVHEVGFDYIYDILKKTDQISDTEFDKYFLYTGDVKLNNRDCYKLEVDYFNYKLVNYTVLANENVTAIAYKLQLSDYFILELNKNIEDYDDVKEGDQIVVPNAYAKKTILYVDKSNNLPIFQAMYDEKGLFEQYEFLNLLLNPKIAEEEFTRDFKDYGF